MPRTLPLWLAFSLVAVAACKRSTPLEPERARPRAPAAPSTPAPGAPSRFELYRTLLANADLPLSNAAHCDNVIGADAGPNPTLGDWIAYNLSVLENGSVELPTECKSEAGAQRCRVEFAVRNDAEGVLWRWGVDFALKPGGALDKSSVICTGAG